MVASISRTILSVSPRSEPPQYHVKCQSVYYRRFVSAISLLGIVCYVEAFLISSKSNILWTLFYESPGKGLILWIACLSVAIHRLDYFRGNYSRSLSTAQQIQRLLGSIDTYYTIGYHLFSSFLIVLMYMVNSTEGMDLGLVTEGRSYERPRLNERVLYLTWLSVYLAIVQSYYRLAYEQDRIELPTVAVRAGEPSVIVSAAADIPQPTARTLLERDVKMILLRALKQTLFTALSGPILYIPIRGKAFKFTNAIAKNFYRINKSNHPHSWPVGFQFFFRSMWVSFLVFFLWEVVHATIKIHFGKEPIRNGQTISQTSTDPNGTLVNGLKCKRPFTKYLAMWELLYITYNAPARRKNLLIDIDRTKTIWVEISDVCLEIIQKMIDNIKNADAPPAQAQSTPTNASKDDIQVPTSNLPHIPVLNDDPFIDTTLNNSRSRIPNRAADLIQAANTTTSPDYTATAASAAAALAASRVAAAIGPHAPDLHLQGVTLIDHLNAASKSFLSSDIGAPFRQTLDRKTSVLIPHSQDQIDAIAALSRLVVCALTEDDFGLVQRSIPRVLETFFLAIDTLAEYIEHPPVHWTDMKSDESKKRMVEPELVLNALKAGLGEVLDSYAPYLNELQLSSAVLSRAKEEESSGKSSARDGIKSAGDGVWRERRVSGEARSGDLFGS